MFLTYCIIHIWHYISHYFMSYNIISYHLISIYINIYLISYYIIYLISYYSKTYQSSFICIILIPFKNTPWSKNFNNQYINWVLNTSKMFSNISYLNKPWELKRNQQSNALDSRLPFEIHALFSYELCPTDGARASLSPASLANWHLHFVLCLTYLNNFCIYLPTG